VVGDASHRPLPGAGLPWAAWLAGIGFVWSNSRPGGAVATTVLIAGVSFNFLYLISSGHYDRRLLVSLAELRRDQPAEPGDPSRVSLVHRYLNATVVRRGKRVLLVGDAQPFDLEVPALYHTCFDPCIFELWMRDRSAEQRLSHFAAAADLARLFRLGRDRPLSQSGELRIQRLGYPRSGLEELVHSKESCAGAPGHGSRREVNCSK
jgi:hypothetical protein